MKIGDKVKFTNVIYDGHIMKITRNDKGIITKIYSYGCQIQLSNGLLATCEFSEFELLEEEKEMKLSDIKEK